MKPSRYSPPSFRGPPAVPLTGARKFLSAASLVSNPARTLPRNVAADRNVRAPGSVLGCALLAAALLLGFIPGLVAEQSSVTIAVDTAKAGAALPADFSGLSFEVALVLPGANGVRYFRPGNLPLLHLFDTLGIRSLRIGGNTSDRDAKQLPSEADLDSLFAFARAADVKVIYCLRLHNGDPQQAAQTVKYIMARYAPQVDCFSIGQEPSAYPTQKQDARPGSERMGAGNEKYRYQDYRQEWKRFAEAIIAAVPEVKFCGPGVHKNADWARRFMAEFGPAQHVTLLTEHLYPGGAGGKVPSPEVGRERMLSPEFLRVCQTLHDGFAPMARSNSLPYRLEEVNNYFNGGATNVSNTFASALWGVDFMYWWAAHGAAGVNFHTGDRVAAGSNLRPSRYTAFFSTTNGYSLRPLGYGLQTFALGSRGRFVPLAKSSLPPINLSAYAVLAADKTLFLTLINKENGPGAHEANFTLTGADAYTTGQLILLTAPNGDVAATSGVTLGGAAIKEDASWQGSWSAAPAPVQGEFKFKLPAATAAVVKLTRP
jgi:hypothetical protein